MYGKHNFKIIDNISAIPGNVYCKDREGVILWCNEGQLKTLGFTDLNQILGKTDFDLCDYETASKIRAVDLRIMTTGNAEIVEEKGTFGNLRVTLSHKAPLKNAAGEIIGIIGTSLNMGQQYEASKQLMQESYNKKTALDNILANLPGHIYWKDKNGVLLGCNDKQAACFGLANGKEFIGKTVFDLLEPESAQRIHESDLTVMRNDIVEIVEEPVKINGKECIFITHKAPLKAPGTGEVIGILGVSIDITRQKELEQDLKRHTQELTKALEVKQRFIRNINHEIRTPMQPILTMPQCLKDNFYKMTDKDKLEFIDCAIKATERLNNLLTTLLDMSKFQEGKFVLEFKLENLEDLLEETVQEFHVSHGNMQVNICKEVQSNILCDKIRLHQVLRNLLMNSIRYGSKEKAITISVSNCIENDTKYIKFTIKDEGIGIPQAERLSVFEPFVEGTLTRSNAGGTGLGLAISKEIVESHKGRIWVDDIKNNEVGTRISFTLPAYISRKQLTPQNSSQKETLCNLLTSLPGHVYWKNQSGVILGVNDKHASCFGFKNRQEVVGKTVFDLLDKELAQKIHDSDLRIMEKDTVEIIEEKAKIKGKEHVFITHKAPLKDASGKIIGVLGVSIDITHNKKSKHNLKQRIQDLATELQGKPCLTTPKP